MKIIKIIFLSLLVISLIYCDEEKQPNRPPVLSISANPTSGAVPLEVAFAASATDPDGNQLSYSWDFDDGSPPTTQQNPVHTFSIKGNYVVTCTVTDNGIPNKSTSKNITITALSPTPTITSISPETCVSHLPAFTLTVLGSDFLEGAKIKVNNEEMVTTHVSSSELSCTITPEDTLIDISSGDVHALPVCVENPILNGEESNTVYLIIEPNFKFSAPVEFLSNVSTDPIIHIASDDSLYVLAAISKTVNLYSSEDLGASWTTNKEIITDLISFSYYSRVTITTTDPEIVHIVYSGEPQDEGDEIYPRTSDLYYFCSSDRGVSWSQPVFITDYQYFWDLVEPVIAYTETRFHLFFLDACEAYYPMYYYRSEDSGASWRMISRVGSTRMGIEMPRLLKESETILHLAFTRYPSGGNRHLYYTQTINNAKYWADWVRISKNPVDSSGLGFTIDPSKVPVIAWLKQKSTDSRDLMFSHSTDFGANWSEPKTLIKNIEMKRAKPCLSMDSAGNINLLYSDGKKDYENIYYLRSIDYGNTWSAPIKINSKYSIAGSYSIVTDSRGRLHVVYRCTEENNKVLYKRSNY